MFELGARVVGGSVTQRGGGGEMLGRWMCEEGLGLILSDSVVCHFSAERSEFTFTDSTAEIHVKENQNSNMSS